MTASVHLRQSVHNVRASSEIGRTQRSARTLSSISDPPSSRFSALLAKGEICPRCPGGARIWPAEAYRDHVANHNGNPLKRRQCRTCGGLYEIPLGRRAATKCPACRGKKSRRRSGGEKIRYMSSTGIEFRDIIRRWRKPRPKSEREVKA